MDKLPRAIVCIDKETSRNGSFRGICCVSEGNEVVSSEKNVDQLGIGMDFSVCF